jgi:hypothetical protein
MSARKLTAFTLTIDVRWIDPEENSPHGVVARVLNEVSESIWQAGQRGDPRLSGPLSYADGDDDRRVGTWGFR